MIHEIETGCPASLRDSVLRGPDRPDFVRDETLADILAATSAKRATHPALVWGARTITYGALGQLADTVARALGHRGARPGHVLGLFLPRGADVVVAQAGIAASGAAWLPFDAEVPLERMKMCLALASATALVTAREWVPRLSGLPVPVWAFEDLLDADVVFSPPTRAQPTDPAYVIFTSGSTGQPKGVVVSQQNICHFLRSENDRIEVRADDRVYQGFSTAFDMSFEEIWLSYLVGATIWIAPADVAVDPDAIAAALVRERITVLHTVPTLMGLIEAPLADLRVVNLGGEACPDTLADRLARPGRRVFNTYGPTETTVSATLAELRPGETVTIGGPLPNVGILIVGADGHPVTEGTAGELCVFGPGVAIGYLGRPDLTAERFVPNPVATGAADARMYRTGDLARVTPEGAVQWLGRTDSQVKVRGFRIELDEITSALAAQPGVAAAATVVRDIAGVEQVVCFAAGRPREAVSTGTLLDALAGRLPRYMVPAHIEIVAELPRLTSGKIDVVCLRAIPLTGAVERDVGGAAPRTEHEGALYEALARLCPGKALAPE
ncbi:MAG: amino acid adenylation domain-containing protein, partial [Acidobacteriota bacterium]